MRMWWLVWGFLLDVAHVTAADNKTRRQLLADILTGYDPDIIPEYDEDYPTNVSVYIAIWGIHSISETTMDYSVDVLLEQRWRDWRLEHEDKLGPGLAASGLGRFELDARTVDRVWQPDTYFINEKTASVHTVTSPNKFVHIYPNGTVLYTMRVAVTLSCTMDLRIFPFDSQCCPIYVQSFGYTRANLELEWWDEAAVTMRKDLDMPQFQLDTTVHTHHFLDTYHSGVYSTLRADLRLRRKSGFYFLQVFVPNVLLVALSWLSFWVDAAAVPARVSLGVTCILTLTTQSSGTRLTLPPVSYVKAIDVWMVVCLMFVFAALLEFAYVNVLLRRPDYRPDTPATDHTQAEDVATSRDCSSRGSTGCMSVAAGDGRRAAARVDRVSRVVFPGTFSVFVIAFSAFCVFYPGRGAEDGNCLG